MFVDSSPVTVTFELFISSYDNWQGRRAGAQVGWRIKNSYESRHAFTFEALNNSKCFKVHAWISHVFVRMLLWQVGHCFGAEVGSQCACSTQCPDLQSVVRCCYIAQLVLPHKSDSYFCTSMPAMPMKTKSNLPSLGAQPKNSTTKPVRPKWTQPLTILVFHCYSLLFIVFCFSFFVRLIVRLWRPLISFTLPLESLELFQGQAQFPPPLHNHTMIEKRWKWTGLGKHSNKWHQRTFFGAKNKWGLSWAQVYKRLNALCWGCRRTIHTLILQALNHLLKALRRQ